MPSKKINNCIDCSTPIHEKSVRCHSCEGKARARKEKEIKNGFFCEICNIALVGHQTKYCNLHAEGNHPCLGCGKLIRKKANRCMSCYHKNLEGTENGFFCEACSVPLMGNQRKYCKAHFGGKHPCTDCGKLVKKQSIRCGSCAQKFEWQDSERRAKMSITMRDYSLRDDVRAKRSTDTKAAWARGVYNEDWRQKHSILGTERMTPEMRERLSGTTKKAWARGDFDSEETRKKYSETTIANWESGVYGGKEWCQNLSQKIKAAWEHGVYDSEEFRQALSLRMKRLWENGTIGNEEWKGKVSRALRIAHARGDFDNLETRQKMSEGLRAAWARGDFDGVFQSPTTIEIETAAALDIMGIEHVGQYRPDGCSYIYDEFVPPRLLIEVNGDYWHSTKVPKNVKRDGIKVQWAEENGYCLVVLWECEIRHRGAWSLIHERVLPILEEVQGE